MWDWIARVKRQFTITELSLMETSYSKRYSNCKTPCLHSCESKEWWRWTPRNWFEIKLFVETSLDSHVIGCLMFVVEYLFIQISSFISQSYTLNKPFQHFFLFKVTLCLFKFRQTINSLRDLVSIYAFCAICFLNKCFLMVLLFVYLLPPSN